LKKNLFSLFCSEIISRIANFTVIIILARSLSVENFGTLNYISILSGYFLYFINFGFEIYGIKSVSKEPFRINELFSKITSLKIYSAIICGIFYCILIWQIPDKNKVILAFLYLFLFLNQAINPFWIFQAIQKMENVFIFKLIESIFYVVIILSLLSIYKNIFVVPVSLFIAQLIAIIISYRLLSKQLTVKYCLVKDIFNELKSSLPIGLSSFFGLIYLNSDIIIIGYLKTDQEVGIYSAAIKLFTVLIVPFQIIFSVFLPVLSENVHGFSDELKKSFKTYLKIINLYSIFTSILIFIFADIIVSLFFGQEYNNAAMPLRIFAVNILFVALSTTFGNPLIVWNLQKMHMYALLAGAVLNIFMNFLLIPNYSYNGAAFATLFSEFVVFIILIIIFNKYIGLKTIFKSDK